MGNRQPASGRRGSAPADDGAAARGSGPRLRAGNGIRGWPGSPRAVPVTPARRARSSRPWWTELSGPEWRCAGATDEELIGLLGRWDAIGSWAEAGKLGVVRELLRRRARPGLGGAAPSHGDLPDQWEEGAGHEVSGALAISLRSADNLTAVAWDLQARLPASAPPSPTAPSAR